MKKCYVFSIILFALSIFSCSKDSDMHGGNIDDTEIGNDDDIYYVRYRAVLSSPGHIFDRYITVNTDIGIQQFTTSGTFDEIFGPVEKGFEAYIRSTANIGWASRESYIYVSKNNGPFALKAFSETSELSFVIDY